MSEFTDTVRTAFECYIMGNKEEALAMLIPGSFYHYYLTIIDAIKTEGPNLSAESTKKLEELRLNLSDKNGAERLLLQHVFLKIDAAKTPEDRNALIDELNDTYIFANFNHQKPADLKRKTVEEVKKEKNIKDHTFKQDEHYNEQRYINQVYQNNNYLNQLHPSLYNKLDFMKLQDY